MSAIMVISMNISDDSWMADYFAEVGKLLAEYGAETVAGSRRVRRIEGRTDAPQRMAVLRFPSLDAIERFWADPRYQAWKQRRRDGSQAEIFVFENAVKDKELV